MTLPFLKHRDESGSASMDVEDEDYSMLDAIADDMLAAFDKSDKSSRKSILKEALSALCDHIKEQDEIQDSKEGMK